MTLSQTSKLDGIRSWSLQAVETCPGAFSQDGSLVEVCKGCYARTGNYRFRNVIHVRQANRRAWREDHWVARMVAALSNERYFRWFDSGDIYHPRLAEKIYEVIAQTPWCQHWLPTRSHKLPRIAPILDRIDQLPNAVVRRSADTLNAFDPDVHGAVVFTGDPPPGVAVCRADEHTPAKCNGCRACWDKNIKTIGYPARGPLRRAA